MSVDKSDPGRETGRLRSYEMALSRNKYYFHLVGKINCTDKTRTNFASAISAESFGVHLRSVILARIARDEEVICILICRKDGILQPASDYERTVAWHLARLPKIELSSSLRCVGLMSEVCRGIEK